MVELFGTGTTGVQKTSGKLENFSNENRIVKNKLFNVKGTIDEKKCVFRIDTGSDVSIIGSKFVKTSGSQILLRNSCQLKYPTGKDVPVKFKTDRNR